MPIYPKKTKSGKTRRNEYRVTAMDSGKQREKTFRGSRKEAEQFLARWQIEIAARVDVDSRDEQSFFDFSSGRYQRHARGRLKTSTWSKRRYQIATLAESFGSKKLSQISNGDIERYYERRLGESVGAVTVNDEIKVLRVILSYARSIGVPASTPTAKRLPERATSGRVLVWTALQVGDLYRAMGAHAPELLPITVALLNTGMRKGEALALRWDSVDIERGLIRIEPSEHWQPKNGKPREIPIGSAVAPWMSQPESERASATWVFPSRAGTSYARWPARAWDRARDAAGVGGSPHICRHTFASHFLAARSDLFLLAQILGHSHSRVTELYSHLLPAHLERARDAVVLPSPVGLVLRESTRPPQARRKLSDAQVIAMRADRAVGDTLAQIAQRYRVAVSTARSVVLCETYIDVA